MKERSIILTILRNFKCNGSIIEDDFEALTLVILDELNIEYDDDLKEK